MTGSDRIVLALDVPTEAEALAWARRVRGRVGMVKVGLRLFTAAGPGLVERLLSEFGPVFLDLKYHDIPNTVAAAVREAAKLGVSMMTVHASGGTAMLRAASEAASDVTRGTRAAGSGTGLASREAGGDLEAGAGLAGTRARILAVTVLTSLGPADLAEAGVIRTPSQQAVALAETAWLSGCDGIVVSPHEVAAIRTRLGPDALLVTPGIRSADDPADDQARAATAREARAAGADLLVIGRPILNAADPEAVLARLAESLI